MIPRQFTTWLFLSTLLAAPCSNVIAFSGQQTEATGSPALLELRPSIRHARTAEEIVLKLQRRHYEQRAFDDDLSSSLLDNYLEHLDPSKHYFSQQDIDAFEQYRHALDDGIRRGNLSPSFVIFNRYREKISADLSELLDELPARISVLDFSLNESVSLEPAEQSWAKNDRELAERTRKTLKNAVLSLRLAEKEEQDILDTLEKRYRNQLNRVNQLNAEDVFQLYMNSLTELYDPHTNYLSPKTSENFSINMRLSLEGIGAVLRRDGEHTVVERLITAGPADKQGELQPTDKIIGVAQGEDSEMVDVIGWRLDEVVELIRGKKGTKVKLKVLSDKSITPDESQQILIVRNTVKLEEQAAKSSTLELHHGDQLRKLGVISLPTFYSDFEAQRKGDKNYRSTTRDVSRLITELEEQQVEGIIIDLRGNGGGSLQEVRQLTGLFVERGPVVQIRFSNGRIKPEANYPNRDYYKKPIAVLIDRLSASASEIFAGAIQDYERGLIIGSPSFGKGTVQQLADLNHGSLKLTEAKFYRVSGESTQHRGVIPDIVLPSLYDSQEIGEASLERALSWDTVRPIRHQSYGDFDKLEEKLYAQHQSRIVDDPDYQYLVGQISLNQKYNELPALPLNEEKRRELIENDRLAREALKNDFELAKGLPISTETEDDDSNVDTSTSAGLLDNADDTEADPRTDFLLTEAGHILLDAIALQLAEQHKSGPPVAALQRNQ